MNGQNAATIYGSCAPSVFNLLWLYLTLLLGASFSHSQNVRYENWMRKDMPSISSYHRTIERLSTEFLICMQRPSNYTICRWNAVFSLSLSLSISISISIPISISISSWEFVDVCVCVHQNTRNDIISQPHSQAYLCIYRAIYIQPLWNANEKAYNKNKTKYHSFASGQNTILCQYCKAKKAF